jgi:hypothetical protein
MGKSNRRISLSWIRSSIYSQQWAKLLSLISLALLAIAIFAAYINPAEGYELDTYASTPLIVWVSVYFGFVVGGGIIVSQVLAKEKESEKIKTWILGLVLLLLSRIVLLYVPYLRGYVSWRGDNIAYLGMIEDILNTGHFTSTNVYPITHILISGISQITGISAQLVANLSTALISVLFVLFIYLLAGVLTNNKRIQILAVAIVGVIILAGGYNIILSPNGWSIFFMPLLFYLYFKRFDRGYRFLLILLLLVYPFFHPLSALIVIVALFVLELARWLFGRFMGKSQDNLPEPSAKFLITYAILELIIFNIWILAHEQLHTNLTTFWQQVTAGTGSGKLTELGQSLDKLNIQGIDFYILLIKLYAADFLLIMISIAGIFWLLKSTRSSKIDATAVFSLLCVWVFCGFVYGGYLLGMPGTSAFAGGQWDRRLLGYVEVLLPLFAAIGCSSLFIYKIQKIAHYRGIIIRIIIILMLFCSLQSIASIYPSPFINDASSQITLMDMTGTKWFLEKKDINVGSTYIMSHLDNFAAGIIGYEESIERTDLHAYGNLLPDNFGYPLSPTLGTYFSMDKYAVITKLDRIIYSTVWKSVGRFSDTDFERLESDTAVSKLYANNEMDIFYVKAR